MATLCNPNQQGTPRQQVPFSAVRGDLDQWFDHFFGGNPRNGGENANAWNAPAALWEDKDNYFVELELPGVSTENVDITYEKGALVISAERPAPTDERKYWHHSRRYGQTRVSLQLPDTVDGEKIDANLQQGVLHLTLAKRPEAQPKKITVKAAE